MSDEEREEYLKEPNILKEVRIKKKVKKKSNAYQLQLEEFKKKNGGLSPWKIAYQKRKEYLKHKEENKQS